MKLFKNILRTFKKPKIGEEREQEISEMLSGIKNLAGLIAKDVMVPRVDMLSIDNSTNSKDLFNFVANSSHSRFPVYQDTIDNIIGILYVKDLIKVAKDLESTNISSLVRHPFFVPETMSLDMLLHEMKKRRVHIAIAVDEYGGVSGLVCLEDIIEEIVGDILDEFDNEEEEFLKISNNVYLVDARFPITKVNELLSMHIPEDDYDTMGGFVYDLFGKIPACYEKVSENNIDYIVQTMEGNRIKFIKVVLNGNNKK